MRFSIIAVGKIREKWLTNGIEEYQKRLKRFGRLDIVEIAGEKLSAKCSPKEVALAVKKEGQQLMARLADNTWAIALDRAGIPHSSEDLARLIGERSLEGNPHISFLIGGSYGLPDEASSSCHQKISFGPLTFPHQLFRLILLEQLYRAEKIRSGETYHK